MLGYVVLFCGFVCMAASAPLSALDRDTEAKMLEHIHAVLEKEQEAIQTNISLFCSEYAKLHKTILDKPFADPVCS